MFDEEYNIIMKKKDTRNTKMSEKVVIQRNYLMWLGKHWMGMQTEELAEAFRITRQAVFEAFKDKK